MISITRRNQTLWALVLGAALVAGCGDDGGGGGDAGDSGMGDAMMGDAMMGDAGDAGTGDGSTGDGSTGDGSMGDGSMGDGGMDAGPPAACEGVDPTVASNTVDTTLTLVGSGLMDGATVLLRDVDSATEVDLGAATVSGDGASATVVVPAGAADQGLYAVVVVSGGAELTCGELSVTSTPPPTVTDVTPDTAYRGMAGDGVLSDRTVTVTGTNFQNTPAVVFVNRTDPSQRYNALLVNFVSETELSAIVPSETLAMPAGEYDVFAVNPDGLSGQWLLPDGSAGTFTITDTPPPTILNVDPFRGPAASEVVITITGVDFQMGAVASLEMPDGTLVDLATDNDTDTPSTVLTATIPGGTLAAGDVVPIRVTNPDGQFDIYYAYSATASSSGKLDPFTPTSVSLMTPRWRHGTSIGFDPFSRGYLYVNGGIDDGGDVLADTEILEVSPLGEPASPRISRQWESVDAPRAPNLLETQREGHALVRAGRYLYAVGGASTNTHVDTPMDSQLDTIERAKILDFDEMPQMRIPTAMDGSGLPIGTWYWQVSALGPWGESLPSREVQILRDGGPVEVCWTAVDGATGYNLYRSVASDGRSGTTRLLVAELPAGDTCVTDTGRDEFQPAPGRLRARPVSGTGLDEGLWAYRVTAVVDGEETVAGYRTYVELSAGEQNVELRWDPVPDAEYNVYRTEMPIAGSPTNTEETYLLASGLTDRMFTDDGSASVDTSMAAPDGIEPMPTGSISTWTTLPTTMNHPREGHDALVLTVPSGNDTDPDRTMMYVTGGRSASTAGTDYADADADPADLPGDTTEYTAIDTSTGDLDGFTLDDELMNVPRAFYVLLTNQGQKEARRPPPPDEPPCIDRDGDGEFSPECDGCDCDDTDPTVYCGAEEVCGDGIDQDCDGSDEPCACPQDMDGDGEDVPECGGCDCDDSDPDILCGIPENCTDTPELCGDGIDQNCDGEDCSCDCPVDADGDGEDIPECGGCDCNDSDDTILCGIPENCDETPELCDDGIDQNCDGDDCTCIILFSDERDSDGLPYTLKEQTWSGVFAPYSPWEPEHGELTVPFFGDGFDRSVADGPIVLIAVAGDEVYDEGGGGNSGMTTFEVTTISTADDETNGQLQGWTVQASELPAGRRTHGLDALLYFDFMWSFSAVGTEARTVPSISPQESAAARYPFRVMPPGDDPAEYFDRFESTSTTFSTSRAYYTTTRINGGLFLVGGHDGTGPVGSIERTVP